MSRRRTTPWTALVLILALAAAPAAFAAEKDYRNDASIFSWLESLVERAWSLSRHWLNPESSYSAEIVPAPPAGTNAAGGHGNCPTAPCGEAGPDIDPDG